MDVQNQRLRVLVTILRASQRAFLENKIHTDLVKARAVAEKIDLHLFDGRRIMADLNIEPIIVQQEFDFF